MGKAFYLIPSVYGHEEGFLLLTVGILFLAWGLIIVRVKYDLLHPAVIFTGGCHSLLRTGFAGSKCLGFAISL